MPNINLRTAGVTPQGPIENVVRADGYSAAEVGNVLSVQPDRTIASTPVATLPLVVANLATLTALAGIGFGQKIRVDSLGRTYECTAPGTSPLAPIAVLDGVLCQWHSLEGTSDQRFLSQPLWYIDRLAGNDENDGTTPATALKTGDELTRRLNGPHFDLAIQMTIVVIEGDSLDLFPTYVSDTAYLHVMGTPIELVRYTVSVSTPITGNQPAKIQCTGVADWDTAGPGGTSLLCNTRPANVRARINGGPRDGALFWLAKKAPDAGDSNAVARLGDTARRTNVASTISKPEVGDVLVFERLSNLERLNVHCIGANPNLTGSTQYPNEPFLATDLHLGRVDFQPLDCGPIPYANLFYGCIIQESIRSSSSRPSSSTRSIVLACWSNAGSLSSIFISFGLVTSLSQTSTPSGTVRVEVGCTTESGHNLLQGCNWQCFGILVITAGTETICDATNAGILVSDRVDVASGLIGYGNAAGIDIRRGAKLRLGAVVPTITGAAGDVRLQPSTTVIPWTAVPWIDGARSGKAVALVPGGAATIPVPYLLASQAIVVTPNTPAGAGAPGTLYVADADRNNTQFGVRSGLATDAGTFNWAIQPVGDAIMIARYF